jgi:hypothetical protein
MVPLVALAPPVAPVDPVGANSWPQPVQTSVTEPTTIARDASFDMGAPKERVVARLSDHAGVVAD